MGFKVALIVLVLVVMATTSALPFQFSEFAETSVGQKRGGMGQCIHDCMNSGGGLSFIQCKTMCY
uniref:Conopeptide n=1 Tax=Conus lenavati TaxID=1519839 RepID=A0A0K8TUQ0_CONLV